MTDKSVKKEYRLQKSKKGQKKKKALRREGLNLKKSYLTYGIDGVAPCARSVDESVLERVSVPLYVQ